jgi:lysozyme
VRLLLLIGSCAALLGACTGQIDSGDAAGADEAALTRLCGGPDRVYGFDVSLHQGRVDWTRARGAEINGQAAVFAAARVSDGLYTPDGDTFVNNWQGMRDAGLIRGAYQFFRPEQDGHAQARLFLDAIAAAGGFEPGVDLPPAVDIEVVTARNTGVTVPSQQLQAGVQAWLNDVEAELHVRPIVYSLSGVSYALGDAFADYPLWVANFYQTCPRMPAAWDRWWIHQFDDRGRIPGVTGYADLDQWNGTRAELDAFIAAAARP